MYKPYSKSTTFSGGLPVLMVLMFCLMPFRLAAQTSGPDFEVETAYIANILELVPGLSVADVGAGDGRYSAFLADQVGVTGQVYATEIDEEKVEAIKNTVTGKENVTVILGKLNSTELPPECCDRILLRRVYHHLEQPQPMLQSLFNALKPGGLIAIIDFLPRHDLSNQDATPEDHGHGTTVDHMIRQVSQVGFELVRQVEDWPSRIINGKATDYAVIFRSPAFDDDHGHSH